MKNEIATAPTRRVRIKTWEEMEKEFGLLYEGCINCTNCFLQEMEDLMPDDRIIEIKDRGFWHPPAAEGFFAISPDMIAEDGLMHIYTVPRRDGKLTKGYFVSGQDKWSSSTTAIYYGILTRVKDGKRKLIGFVDDRVDQRAIDKFAHYNLYTCTFTPLCQMHQRNHPEYVEQLEQEIGV